MLGSRTRRTGSARVEAGRHRVKRPRTRILAALALAFAACLAPHSAPRPPASGTRLGAPKGSEEDAAAPAESVSPPPPPPPKELPRGGRAIFPVHRLLGFCGTPAAPALGALPGTLPAKRQ